MDDMKLDSTVTKLGECRIPSPLAGVKFVQDDARVIPPTAMREIKGFLQALNSVLAATGQPRNLR